jgi:hypothetical protein
MEEEYKDKVRSIVDHPVLNVYEVLIRNISGFPPKRDINFSINLIPRASLLSNTSYSMNTP